MGNKNEPKSENDIEKLIEQLITDPTKSMKLAIITFFLVLSICIVQMFLGLLQIVQMVNPYQTQISTLKNWR